MLEYLLYKNVTVSSTIGSCHCMLCTGKPGALDIPGRASITTNQFPSARNPLTTCRKRVVVALCSRREHALMYRPEAHLRYLNYPMKYSYVYTSYTSGAVVSAARCLLASSERTRAASWICGPIGARGLRSAQRRRHEDLRAQSVEHYNHFWVSR
jgi:hypothetical protein